MLHCSSGCETSGGCQRETQYTSEASLASITRCPLRGCVELPMRKHLVTEKGKRGSRLSVQDSGEPTPLLATPAASVPTVSASKGALKHKGQGSAKAHPSDLHQLNVDGSSPGREKRRTETTGRTDTSSLGPEPVASRSLDVSCWSHPPQSVSRIAGKRVTGQQRSLVACGTTSSPRSTSNQSE
jgi:hypothetical protein